jgi:hypothetical protein
VIVCVQEIRTVVSPRTGAVPEHVDINGVRFTWEQAVKIAGTMRPEVKLDVTPMRRGRLKVHSDLMPEGTYAVFERHGEFSFHD